MIELDFNELEWSKIRYLPYEAHIEILFGWTTLPIGIIFHNDENKPIEWSCGIAGEIEQILDIEPFRIDTYPEIERVEYHSTYQDVPLVLFHFPRQGCYWVETGEEEIIKKKLIC
jgi:hypothetical protein